MKTVSGFLILAAMLYINPQAQGQCSQGPDGSCVISFSISPGEITGDLTQAGGPLKPCVGLSGAC